MSVTPSLGSFNKDKVANKFGIQLKPKNTNTQIQQSLSPTTGKKISSLTKTNSISDSHLQNQSNGNLSKSPQMIRKMFEQSSETKSNNNHLSISTIDQRRASLNLNVNHSTNSNLLTTKPMSNSQLLLQTSNRNKSLSISPSTSRRTSIKKTPERSLSPNIISKQSIQSKSPERPLSPVSIPKRPSTPLTTTTTKTEQEIEHQKDQPLYKRQLSKTLDNNTSTANKSKHPYELPNSR